MIRFTVSMAACIFEYRGRTWLIMRNRSTASTGRATRKIMASSPFKVKATPVAVKSITGPLQKGLRPVDTEFWMFVTSLVSLVTREETRKWSMLEKE